MFCMGKKCFARTAKNVLPLQQKNFAHNAKFFAPYAFNFLKNPLMPCLPKFWNLSTNRFPHMMSDILRV